ncbi:stage III sporulation protein AF [Sporolactobacillus kofuensis]|uniref:Stage III sporulation protein AF n=1 Tax=Sporolactobacillus kofuensis TaxID=269672 RepID=A0ABW1WJL4_9BACL|nr:stage III sporulation protein AF [Sporolactobacillus kofuensis]MCO7176591.1 stage III sporulation protein AF [Sporolactobacillus kofuensis]
MSYLVNWISQIILIVLFAVILELLIPTGTFQKYIKFVIGLILVVALLDPVLKIFQIHPDQLLNGLAIEQKDDSIKKETARQKKEIENAQAAYIQEQVAVQMNDQVKEELNEKYGLQITHMDVSAKQKNRQEMSVDNVTVILEKTTRNHRDQESGIRTIQPVKNVSINLDDPDNSKQTVHEHNEMNKVRSFLAKRWALNKRLITVHMEGGD